MESNSEDLSKSLERLKEENYFSLLEPNSYCDFRFEDKWSVGKVNKKENKQIKIQFEQNGFCLPEMDIKQEDITYFRRYSKPTNRNSKEKGNQQEVINNIKKVIATKFNYASMNPYDIIQLFRGNIFFSYDTVYSISNASKSTLELSLQIIEAYLEMISLYMMFLKENRSLIPIYFKKPEYCLVDWRYSLISFHEDAMIIIRKLFCKEHYYLPFYNDNKDQLCKAIINRYKAEKKKKETKIRAMQKTNPKIELNSLCLPDCIEPICQKKVYDPDVGVRGGNFLIYPAIIPAYVIDYFNFKNGFQNTLDVIITKELNLPYSFIISQLTLINFCLEFINQPLFKNEAENLKTFALYLVNNMTESDIRENSKEVINLMLENLIRLIILDDESINQLKEEIVLIYYYHCFITKILEKQIFGINAFNSIINNIRRSNGDYNWNILSSHQNDSVTLKNINYATLVKFLSDHKIMNILLSDNLHEEIFTRSFDIIYVMYQYNWGLSENVKEYSHKVFETLWKHVNEKHLGLSPLIEKVFCEMAAIADEEDKQFLYQKIKQLVLCSFSFSKDNLTLLKTITEKCLINSQPNQKEKEKENLKTESTNEQPKSTSTDDKRQEKQIEEGSVRKDQNEEKKDEQIQKEEKPIEVNESIEGTDKTKIIEDKDESEIQNHQETNTLIPITELDEKKVFGLKLFWEFIQDEYLADIIKNNREIEPTKIIDFSLTTINQILNHHLIQIDNQTRELFLSLSFEHISKQSNVIQSMIMIKNLFLNGRYVNIYQSLFQKLNNDKAQYPNGIFDLLIKDLQRYLSKVNDKAQDAQEDQSNIIFEGFYTHHFNIENRIDLIILLINKKNGIELSIENLIDLWEIVNKTTYKELLNQSIFRNLRSIDYSLLENYFNTILISNEHFMVTTQESFDLFLTTFEEINKRNNHFASFNSFSYFIDANAEGDIIGIDKLWSMLKEFSDENMQTKVASVLCDICINVKSINHPKTADYWKAFISKLFIEIRKAHEAKEEKALQGLLLLLRYIHDKTGAKGIILNQKDYNYKADNALLYTIINLSKHSQSSIKIGDDEPFGSVRFRLSYVYDLPVNSIKLTQKDKIFNLSNDFELCKDLLTPEEDLIVSEEVNPLSKLDNNPKKILLKDDNLISIMIDLLQDFDKKYLKNIWDFIQLIPESDKISNIIESLGKGEEEMADETIFNFDQKNVYYMSYMVTRIKNCILGKVSDGNWLKLFSKTSTCKKLYEAFFQMSILQMTSIESLNCLNDILLIITTVFEYYQNKATTDLPLKILKLIREIFEDSYRRNNSNDSNRCPFASTEIIILQYIFSFISKQDLFEVFIHIFINEEQNSDFVFILTKGTALSKNKDINLQFELTLTRIIVETQIIKEELKISLIKYILKVMLDENNIKDAITASEQNELISDIDMGKKEVKGLMTIEDNFYFTFISTIIDKGNKLVPLDFEAESTKLLNLIQKETEHDITGYLILLCVILNYSESAISDILKQIDVNSLIYEQLLFSKCCADPVNQPTPKCLSKSSRKAGYRLLVFLMFHQNNEALFNKIIMKHSNFHYLSKWRKNDGSNWQIAQREDKEKQSYVGLKNLGCTCYMNCILQILFMIPNLRESIISSKCTYDSKNSLYQLKCLLSSLQLSESQYIDTKEFAQNFDDQPLDVRQQMDIDEFFNFLVDKIENLLKGTENADLFRHFFQGKNSDELVFKGECSHRRENVIDYYSIPLQVKNKKSLYESLDSMIEGELMEKDNAIFCSQCDKKFPAIKYQTFKVLPRVLLFGLKRFEFNYNTMTKIKLNDYYEFPIDLDMTKYTTEYIKNQTFTGSGLYKLKAVVIHSGHSEGGHYYSYIKDFKSENWYEFNDTLVRKFNIEDLKQEAFGGNESGVNNRREMFEKSHNAYLLFYEKVDESDCEKFEEVKLENQKESNNNIPYCILDQINLEISLYWIQRIIFDTSYHQFLLEMIVNRLISIYGYLSFEACYKMNSRMVIGMIDNEYIKIRRNAPNITNLTGLTEKNIVKLFKTNAIKIEGNKEEIKQTEIEKVFVFFCSFFFHILLRSKDYTFMPPSVELMKFCINQNKECAKWIIQEFSNEDTIAELLINNPNSKAKKIIVGIIFLSMIKLFYENDKEQLINFVHCIIIIIKDNKENDIQFLFFILYRYTLLHPDLLDYLSNQTKLLEFLVFHRKFRKEKDSAIYEALCKSEESLKIKATFTKSILSKRILCLNQEDQPEIIDEESKGLNRKDRQSYSRSDNYQFILICQLLSVRSLDKKIISHYLKDNILEFFQEINSKTLAYAMSNMINRLSTNKEMTKHWQKTIVKLVGNSQISSFLELIMMILKRFIVKCNDDLKDFRIKTTIDLFIYDIILEQSHFYPLIYYVDFLIKLFSFDCVKKHTSYFKSYLNKVIRLLKTHEMNKEKIEEKTIEQKAEEEKREVNKIESKQEKIKEKPKIRSIIIQGIIDSSAYPVKADLDSDVDLTDFPFQIEDTVFYDGQVGKVVSQLDEMIEIEIVKNTMHDNIIISHLERQWVETDSTNLTVKSLVSKAGKKLLNSSPMNENISKIN